MFLFRSEVKGMRGECVYIQVMVQMYMRGWDSRTLAEKAGLSYSTIRRKLRGLAPLHLEEARTIQTALNCGLTLDELFARQDRWTGDQGQKASEKN